MNEKGILVAIEGVDAAGKTTIAKEIGKQLDNSVYCKCQGNSKTFIGRLARRLPCTLFFLLEILTISKKIKDALAAGKTVLCDRYYFSVLAHEKAQRIHNRLVAKLLKPFLIAPEKVVWVDVSSDIAVERLRQLPTNKFHVELIRRPGLIVYQQIRFQLMFCGKNVFYLNTSGADASVALKEVVEFIKGV